jgi:cell division protein FtsL
MATAPAIIPEIQKGPRLAASRAGRSQARELLFEKRIDNSRLYREVDPEKHRECFALLGMAALGFMFVFFFAWEHFRCVRYGYEIEQLRSQQAALAVWNQKLHLEQALLADPQRIDRLARADLGLAPPQTQQIVRLEGNGAQPNGSTASVLARSFGTLKSRSRGNPREP